MAAISGVSFLFQPNVGTDAVPSYATMAGGRGATLTMDVDEIDVTCKDSNLWHEGLPSTRKWSLDFKGLLLEDQYTYDVVRNCFLNQLQLRVRMLTPGGKSFTGKATLKNFSIDGPHDDAMSISGSFQGTGALAYN
jgi:TP901-1 family phage major tail protein